MQLAHPLVAAGVAAHTRFHEEPLRRLWQTLHLTLTIVLASTFGGVGAAAVWLGVNCLLLLTTVPIAHRKLLPGATVSFFVRDVALPLAAALIGAGVARFAYRQRDSYLFIALQLALAYGFAAVCCVAASGLAR